MIMFVLLVISMLLDFKDTGLTHLSANGKCLQEVIEKYSLQVLNYHPSCTGKWTRVREKSGVTERSVIDYIITNQFMSEQVSFVIIDEERLMTLEISYRFMISDLGTTTAF